MKNLELIRVLTEDLDGQPQAVQAPEPVVDEQEETLNPFAFGRLAAERDDNGLPKNHPSYVKRSCNVCYGRGYRVQVFGGARFEACRCVQNGYKRTLRAFSAAVKVTAGSKEEVLKSFLATAQFAS